MMRKYTILAAALLFAAVSCIKNELMEDKGVGTLSMDMSISQQTKAMSQADLLATATVKIYKADFSGLVRSYTYENIPSPFYLAADTYRVDVEAGEAVKVAPKAASWEQKSYKGSQEFVISPNQVTDVEVEAVVNNAVTNISFDPTVAENFDAGYTFTIGLDDESKLVYDASKSGAEGYFIVDGLKAPSFKWTFNAVRTKDGSSFVKTGEIKDIVPGKLYTMTLKYTIKDGDLELTLLVDYTTDVFDDTIVFEPVSTGLSASSIYEIWAAHATIHAVVDPVENAGATVQFAYAKEGADWTVVDAVDDQDGTFHAEISQLTPATEYTYKLLINGEDKGTPKTITTAAAPNLPNASFEYASKVSGQSYYKFYDPNCGVEEGMTKFWGSGNGEDGEPGGVAGSASMGVVITEVSTDVPSLPEGEISTQSVLAKNGSKMGMLTAGNIFTGDFAELIVNLTGNSGGKVNFGRPWTTRPSGLKLYCKYNTGTVDVINGNPGNLTSSDYDRAQIKVAIGTWTQSKYKGSKNSPVQVNTLDESTFVDFYTDENTIANGDLIIYNDGYSVNRGAKVEATTTEWIEYYIPLDYRKFNEFPTHIIISCSAAQYGDYFTGCSSSQLWLDHFELIYE